MMMLQTTMLLVLATSALAHNNICTNDVRPQDTAADLHFSESFGPPKSAFACRNRVLFLSCCMRGFSQIEWYQRRRDEWKKFFSISDFSDYRRQFENSQVVSIDYAYLDATDVKCVGFGPDSTVNISHVIQLHVHECVSWNKEPAPYYPPEQLTVLDHNIGDDVNVSCEGFFGYNDVKTPCQRCNIGWTQVVDGKPIPVPVITNESLQHAYCINQPALYDLGMRSTLYVRDLSSTDYNSEFICWMMNDFGKLEAGRTIRFHYQKPTWPKQLLYALSGFVLLVVLIIVVFSHQSARIRLYLSEFVRRPPDAEGLDYDVLLIETNDDDSMDTLGYRLCHRLRTNSPYKYNVFHWPLELQPGQCSHEEFFAISRRCRCVVAVLSESFVRNEICVTCLNHIVTHIDIVYVLDGRIQSTNDDRLLGLDERVRVLMPHRHVVWPVEFNIEQTDGDDVRIIVDNDASRAVNKFWNNFRSAIPACRQQNINENTRLLGKPSHRDSS